MICIECTYPVTTLYTSYSPTNIRLTACPSCNKFADKYIEYDSVLIFIDLLLLRPQAYRHMVFNVLTPQQQQLQEKKDQDQTSSSASTPNPLTSSISSSKPNKNEGGGSVFSRFTLFCKQVVQLHPQTWRIWVLITLFDVYLTWARAEQQQHRGQDPAPFSFSSSSSSSSANLQFQYILGLPVLAQYWTFLLFCLADSVVSHATIQFLANMWLGWRNPAALSTALMISSSSKLFPILMVIWSYDVPLAATVLGWAVSFNTIEALTIVLQCGYVKAIVITVLAAVSRLVFCEYGLLRLLEWTWKQFNF